MIQMTYIVEPFLSSTLSHTALSSAYPPTRAYGFSPFVIYFAWADPQYDAVFYQATKEAARRITEAAVKEGLRLNEAEKYPNYAIYGTRVEEMYGGNVDRLRELRKRVDPENVMSLTGGFRF
jgi:FAD/FMN-containing dehydrogenase